MTTTGGIVVYQARFLPFGGSRGWGSAPTTAWLDRGYTGHLHNDGVGLIYMNARYYVPSLGRFASADTIVPDLSNPQAFNRFSYVYNNPIRFTDPSGHCPSPIAHSSHSNSNIVCLAGFIPTNYSQGPLGVTFTGDNRNFSANSSMSASRFWLWIDADTGDILQQYVHPTTATNDKMFAYLDGYWGHCAGSSVCTYAPADMVNDIAVSVLENGTIRVTYSILCSHPLCYLGVGPDGTIDFIPDGNGGFKTSGSVERFPNLEAYHWNNGELQATLFQHQFFPANEIASGTASLGTSSGMVGTHSFGHGQRHMWNIPPVPTITLPQGGGGGSWNWGNPLFY